MTESKVMEHTAGPWKRIRSEDWSVEYFGDQNARSGPEWITIGNDTDDLPVALVLGFYGDEEVEAITKANANLIQAAPIFSPPSAPFLSRTRS